MSALDWSVVLDIGVGVGVFLVGVGALVGGIALAGTLRRVDRTLDVVDAQLETMGKPIGETLEHVESMADTADQTLARVRGVVATLEGVADSVSQTADLAKGAIAPAIINIGATLAGISAGLRRFVRGRTSGDGTE